MPSPCHLTWFPPWPPSDFTAESPGDHQAAVPSEHSGAASVEWWNAQALVSGSSMTFLLLGKIRKVDRDSAPPAGPATPSGVHGCLPRSLWLSMPKVALSGGDSDQGLWTGLVRGFASRHICPGPSVHPGRTDGRYPQLGEPSCGDRHPAGPSEQIDASRKVSSREAQASQLACISTDPVLCRGRSKVQMAGSGWQQGFAYLQGWEAGHWKRQEH